jgi:hypothetical protein
MNPDPNRTAQRPSRNPHPASQPAGTPSFAALSRRVGCKLIAALLCLVPAAAHAADKKAPPAKPASEYAANDSHPTEQVTVAAEPCDDP